MVWVQLVELLTQVLELALLVKDNHTMVQVFYCKHNMTPYCRRTVTAPTLYCKLTALH